MNNHDENYLEFNRQVYTLFARYISIIIDQCINIHMVIMYESVQIRAEKPINQI